MLKTNLTLAARELYPLLNQLGFFESSCKEKSVVRYGFRPKEFESLLLFSE
uniref:DUF5659 domain-containing protein n=1 Tax=Schistosoma curassoni TaxID=6186 RepID=A0A183KX52_9TREM